MLNAPCKGCQDRKAGCHGKCGKYREWRAEIDRIAEKRRREQEANEVAAISVRRVKQYHWNRKGRVRKKA